MVQLTPCVSCLTPSLCSEARFCQVDKFSRLAIPEMRSRDAPLVRFDSVTVDKIARTQTAAKRYQIAVRFVGGGETVTLDNSMTPERVARYLHELADRIYRRR